MNTPPVVLDVHRRAGADFQIRRIVPPRLVADHGKREWRVVLARELRQRNVSLLLPTTTTRNRVPARVARVAIVFDCDLRASAVSASCRTHGYERRYPEGEHCYET